MGKLSEISAEMDEQNIPEDKRNSLIDRVSAGMHAAEKKIDSKKIKVENKSVLEKIELHVFDDDELKIIQKLRAYANKTHNIVTYDGKSYVRVGVYQYLANLLHISPEFDFEPESTQSEVWCVCTLKNQSGCELTHTTMYADKDEEFLKDKPAYAVLGMAQTRAFARAMKNVYGFLIEAAGYQSVAIEEIEKKGK